MLHEAEEMIGALPHNMRKEILSESIGTFLQSFPLLQKNFSKKFIEKLVFQIKSTRYSPCDRIYNVFNFKLISFVINFYFNKIKA